MKTFKAILLLGVVVVFGVGCKTLRPTTQSASTTVEKDSTSTHTTERFVNVFMPGDTVTLYELIECPDVITPSLTPATPKPFKKAVQGKHSNGSIEVDTEGRLHAIFSCNEWRDSVKVRDTEITRLKSISKTDSTTVTVHVKFIPKIYKAAMWYSCISLVILLMGATWYAAKFYFKF